MTIPDFINACIDGYKVLIAAALPVVFFIGACNTGLNIFISAAFGGRLHIGGDLQ